MAPFSPLPPTYKFKSRPLPAHSFNSNQLWFSSTQSSSTSAPKPKPKPLVKVHDHDHHHHQYLSVDRSKSQFQDDDESSKDSLSLKKSYSFLLFLFFLVISYIITSSSYASYTSNLLEPLISYQQQQQQISDVSIEADVELTGWRRLRVGELHNVQHSSYRRSKSKSVLDALSRIRKEHQDKLNSQHSKLGSTSVDFHLKLRDSNFHKEQADKVESPSTEETSTSTSTPPPSTPAPGRRDSSSSSTNTDADTDTIAEVGNGNVQSHSDGDINTGTGNEEAKIDQYNNATITASLSESSVPTATNYPSPDTEADDVHNQLERKHHRHHMQVSQEDGGI